MSESFDEDELEATVEELEQARRLSEALERGNAGDDREIEGLVETARLVEVSRRFELSPERQRALKAELSADFDRHVQKQQEERHRAPLLRRLALWFPLPLAAAAAFVLLIRMQHAPEQAALATDLTEAAASKLAAADASVDPRPALVRAQALALAEAFGRMAQDETKAKRKEPGAFLPSPSELGAAPAEEEAPPEQKAAAVPAASAARATLERELSLHRAGLMAALDAKLR